MLYIHTVCDAICFGILHQHSVASVFIFQNNVIGIIASAPVNLRQSGAFVPILSVFGGIEYETRPEVISVQPAISAVKNVNTIQLSCLRIADAIFHETYGEP